MKTAEEILKYFETSPESLLDLIKWVHNEALESASQLMEKHVCLCGNRQTVGANKIRALIEQDKKEGE